MDQRFQSGPHELACHIKVPSSTAADDSDVPGLILCHGFPIGPIDARRSAGTYPQLIDRIAYEVGYAAMAFTFRGCGDSGGDFSLQRVDRRSSGRGRPPDSRDRCGRVSFWSVATTGGSIAICVGGRRPRVCAVGLLSPRPDFDDWADHPRRFLDHAREIGAIRTPGFPRLMDDWSAGIPPVPADGRCPPVRPAPVARDAWRR